MAGTFTLVNQCPNRDLIINPGHKILAARLTFTGAVGVSQNEMIHETATIYPPGGSTAYALIIRGDSVTGVPNVNSAIAASLVFRVGGLQHEGYTSTENILGTYTLPISYSLMREMVSSSQESNQSNLPFVPSAFNSHPWWASDDGATLRVWDTGTSHAQTFAGRVELWFGNFA